MTTRIALAALAAACAAAPLAAMAQDYPNKPITYIVPFTPGGTTDVIGRTMATELDNVQSTLEGVDRAVLRAARRTVAVPR